MSFTVLDEDTIPRDRWKRPLVVPPGGGHPKAYTRCTRYIDCLDDKFKLGLWQQRMVALGLADRPDLMLAVAAHRDDKRELDNLCAQAKEAAKSSAAATTGTALHAICQQHDEGKKLRSIPEVYKADLEAYIDATKDMDHVHIERFMVRDDIEVGGTPDRVTKYQGQTYIADIKTGATLDFGWLEIAMQLAIYSRSALYRHPSGDRENVAVDQDHAIVIHLPAGQNTARLLWVDIAAGWEAVQVAKQVREWRKRKNLSWPVEDQMSLTEVANAFSAAPDDVANAIATANSVEELGGLWMQHRTNWTDELTRLAAQRKAILQQAA